MKELGGEIEVKTVKRVFKRKEEKGDLVIVELGSEEQKRDVIGK